MARTIVQTNTPGWYLDPETGKKTRRNGDDRIVSQAEWEKIVARAGQPTQVVDVPVTALPTGKVAVGKTTTITCIDCGAERTVKVQDAFQVKRCVEDQEKHRKALQREKTKAKRAAAREAKRAAKA